MDKKTQIDKILLDFEDRFNAAIQSQINYMPKEFLAEMGRERVFHPGLFVALSYSVSKGVWLVPKRVWDFSIDIEFLHQSFILRDKIFSDMLDSNDKPILFEQLLLQLTCGASGLANAVSSPSLNHKQSELILRTLKNLLDQEIASMNARAGLLQDIKTKSGIKIKYNEYLKKTASRLVKYAILFGNSLNGRLNNDRVSIAGDKLSFCFDIWKNTAVISRFANNDIKTLSMFDAIPFLPDIPQSGKGEIFHNGFIIRRDLNKKFPIGCILQTLDSTANEYFKESLRMFSEIYGNDSEILVSYCELCKNQFRDVARL